MEEKKVWDEQAINEFKQDQIKALKTSLLVWAGTLAYLLIFGLVACLFLYGFLMLIMFVINLICALKSLKFMKKIEKGEADLKEIYYFYEGMNGRCMIMFCLNLFCGGLFGLIGTIYEMRIAQKALDLGEEILGDDFKNERVAADRNARMNYCVFCKKNRREGYKLYRIADGVICHECAGKYVAMLPKRTENPMDVTGKKFSSFLPFDRAVLKLGLSSKDLEERLEYRKQNNEMYSYFSPTKILYDGCLELDEANSLFRVVAVNDGKYGYDSFNSARNGVPSGLIHPYSDVLGICYEKVYRYDDGVTYETIPEWEYTKTQTIVLAISDKYLTEEVFTLKTLPSKGYSDPIVPQIKYAKQAVEELHEIFGKPVLNARVFHAEYTLSRSVGQ